MASPYDILLEPKSKSPYDVLLDPIKLPTPQDVALVNDSAGSGLISPSSQVSATPGDVVGVLTKPFVAIPNVSDPHYRSDISGTLPAEIHSVAAGITNLAKGAVEGIESPLGAASLALGGAPSGVQKAVSALFAGWMAVEGVKTTGEARKVLTDPNATIGEKVKAVGQPALDFITAGLAGAHAADGVVGPNKVSPEQSQEATQWIDNYLQQRKAEQSNLPVTADALKNENAKIESKAATPGTPEASGENGRGNANTETGASGAAATESRVQPEPSVTIRKLDERGRFTQTEDLHPVEAAKQLRVRQSLYQSVINCLG
jgi:hypothetical protein